MKLKNIFIFILLLEKSNCFDTLAEHLFSGKGKIISGIIFFALTTLSHTKYDKKKNPSDQTIEEVKIEKQNKELLYVKQNNSEYYFPIESKKINTKYESPEITKIIKTEYIEDISYKQMMLPIYAGCSWYGIFYLLPMFFNIK